ncbi:MAG: hypothetical protein ACRCYR_03715 [Phycicoccus sp.]
MKERWFFDGWELTTGGGVRDWASREGTSETAVYVGENTIVANRHGEIWRPKTPGPGRVAIDLWLNGPTPEAADVQWQQLLRAVRRGRRLVTIERHRSSGEVIYALGEVVATIAPTFLGQRTIRASVTFNVPEGKWWSSTEYVHQCRATVGGPTYDMTGFEPSTEENDALLLTITGPATNVSIRDVTDGLGPVLIYGGTIPASRRLKVDCKTWVTTQQDSAGNTLAWGFDPVKLTFSGTRYFTLTHSRPGQPPKVSFMCDGATGSTTLEVRGRRAYAC